MHTRHAAKKKTVVKDRKFKITIFSQLDNPSMCSRKVKSHPHPSRAQHLQIACSLGDWKTEFSISRKSHLAANKNGFIPYAKSAAVKVVIYDDCWARRTAWKHCRVHAGEFRLIMWAENEPCSPHLWNDRYRSLVDSPMTSFFTRIRYRLGVELSAI